MVDGALRSAGAPFRHYGSYFETAMTGLPSPVQVPRPPITLAGASKTVRDVAVDRAECWNTHGAFGVGPAELHDHLDQLNRDVDTRCETAGRDPTSLRRSVLLLDSLSPWSEHGRLAQLAEQMTAIGFDELVAFWPWEDAARSVFDQDAGDLSALLEPATRK